MIRQRGASSEDWFRSFLPYLPLSVQFFAGIAALHAAGAVKSARHLRTYVVIGICLVVGAGRAWERIRRGRARGRPLGPAAQEEMARGAAQRERAELRRNGLVSGLSRRWTIILLVYRSVERRRREERLAPRSPRQRFPHDPAPWREFAVGMGFLWTEDPAPRAEGVHEGVRVRIDVKWSGGSFTRVRAFQEEPVRGSARERFMKRSKERSRRWSHIDQAAARSLFDRY